MSLHFLRACWLNWKHSPSSYIFISVFFLLFGPIVLSEKKMPKYWQVWICLHMNIFFCFCFYFNADTYLKRQFFNTNSPPLKKTLPPNAIPHFRPDFKCTDIVKYTVLLNCLPQRGKSCFKLTLLGEDTVYKIKCFLWVFKICCQWMLILSNKRNRGCNHGNWKKFSHITKTLCSDQSLWTVFNTAHPLPFFFNFQNRKISLVCLPVNLTDHPPTHCPF